MEQEEKINSQSYTEAQEQSVDDRLSEFIEDLKKELGERKLPVSEVITAILSSGWDNLRARTRFSDKQVQYLLSERESYKGALDNTLEEKERIENKLKAIVEIINI